MRANRVVASPYTAAPYFPTPIPETCQPRRPQATRNHEDLCISPPTCGGFVDRRVCVRVSSRPTHVAYPLYTRDLQPKNALSESATHFAGVRLRRPARRRSHML